MIRFYFHPSPNPLKVALFLEEAGLAYEVVPVDTRKGEQHKPGFRAVNPNGKLPAIVDTARPVRLSYLREPPLSRWGDRHSREIIGQQQQAGRVGDC